MKSLRKCAGRFIPAAAAAGIFWGLATQCESLNVPWVEDLVNGRAGSQPGVFPSYNETRLVLNQLTAWNPLFATRFPIGISYECRILYAYHLSGIGALSRTGRETRVKALSEAFLRSLLREEGDEISRCLSQTVGTFVTDDAGQAPTLPPSRTTTQEARAAAVGGENLRNVVTQRDMEELRFAVAAGKRLMASDENPGSTPMDPRLSDDSNPTVEKFGEETPSKLGDKPGGNVGEGTAGSGRLLVTALHHAREPTSLTATMHFYRYLLGSLSDWYRRGDLKVPGRSETRTETPGVARLIPSMMLEREVLYMPFVNPDGYVAIERTGNRNIRKNQRPTCSSAPKSGHVLALNGVDLNRNYATAWAKKHNKCDPEEFEGERPFSEPETRAVRRAATIFSPQIALNFHSYGDVWTRPWNCCQDRKLSARDAAVFEEVSTVLNVTKFGSAPELTALSYLTTGEADDYLLEELGILSLSPEVGPEDGGFYPPARAVQEMNVVNTPRVLRLLLKAGSEVSAMLSAAQCRGADAAGGVGPAWNLILFNSGLSSTGPSKVHLRFLPAESNDNQQRNGGAGEGGNGGGNSGVTTAGAAASARTVVEGMTLYDPGHFDHFRAMAEPSPGAASDLLYGGTPMEALSVGGLSMAMPRTIITTHNFKQDISDEDAANIEKNTLSLDMPEGIDTREQFEISFSRFLMDRPLPETLEICLSKALPTGAAPASAPHLQRSIRAGLCSCGRIALSTERGGCPFGRTALQIAPYIATPSHPCYQ